MKNSRKAFSGFFGLAVTLMMAGAGCASSETSEQPQPQVQVQTEGNVPVDIQVLPNQPPTAEPPKTEPPAPAPAPAPSAEPPTKGSTSYKDGTYKAQGDYFTHAGPESVNITLTVKNDVVVDSQFQGTPNAMMSARYMDMFSAGYKTFVIGKNLAQACNVGKVSGSSLTPQGFNDACLKIQAQAKA